MNDWQSRLREADPGSDAVMSPADVQRIRRAVMSAATGSRGRDRLMWPRAFVVTATVLLMVCASMLTALQRTTRGGDGALAPETTATSEALEESLDSGEIERQQLQFKTPGGTRIIWVFDSQFEAKGTLP
jgi:hypothetical protein